jgi:hypothetical protein
LILGYGSPTHSHMPLSETTPDSNLLSCLRCYKTKAKYSILEENVYNFDKAGFMMSKITTQLVVTESERRSQPKAIQPGNCEWVTVIQGINAAGWALSPFIIFAGKHHLSA